MKISSPAYLIIGLIISGISWLIEFKSGKSMMLFFYIGLLFIVVGVFKIVIKLILPKESPEQKPTVQSVLTQQQQQQNKPFSIKACHRCKVRVNPSNNFCYQCGTRLR